MKLEIKPKWKYLATDGNGKTYLFDTAPVFDFNRKTWVCPKEWNQLILVPPGIFIVSEKTMKTAPEDTLLIRNGDKWERP